MEKIKPVWTNRISLQTARTRTIRVTKEEILIWVCWTQKLTASSEKTHQVQGTKKQIILLFTQPFRWACFVVKSTFFYLTEDWRQKQSLTMAILSPLEWAASSPFASTLHLDPTGIRTAPTNRMQTHVTENVRARHEKTNKPKNSLIINSLCAAGNTVHSGGGRGKHNIRHGHEGPTQRGRQHNDNSTLKTHTHIPAPAMTQHPLYCREQERDTLQAFTGCVTHRT